MKSVLVMWSVLLMIGSAFASEVDGGKVEKYETRVLRVQEAATDADSSLVFLETQGRVLRIDASQKAEFTQFKAAVQSGDVVKVKVREMGDVDYIVNIDTKPISARLLESLGHSKEEEGYFFNDVLPTEYEPTDVGTVERADAIFSGLDKKMRKRSQCYQRAHLWALSMWRSKGIKSQKVFMFYTDRYIRAYKFKWWFHVAPFVVANKVEYVVDRTFTNEALEMKDWTDVFMYNGASCPTISKYSEYENDQSSQFCYLLKVPMYYYQPVNLESLENDGEVVNEFRSWEVEHARKADK